MSVHVAASCPRCGAHLHPVARERAVSSCPGCGEDWLIEVRLSPTIRPAEPPVPVVDEVPGETPLHPLIVSMLELLDECWWLRHHSTRKAVPVGCTPDASPEVTAA